MDGEDNSNPGVMRRAFFAIFDQIEKSEALSLQTEYMVTAQYVQIYNEEVYDLLSDNAALHQNPLQAHSFCFTG